MGSPDAFGGNVKFENSYEFIFPVPFIKNQSSMRLAAFLDGGQVFDTNSRFKPAFEEIRWSTGIALQWNTFLGPLGFSFGKALNDVSGDETEFFQFSLGQAF